MKRFITLLLLAAMALTCTVTLTSCDKGEFINVYNWGLYISDGKDGTVDVNKEFTKKTGIKVNYSYFTSNEDMYAKLRSGGSAYDVVFPSDYMIERMIAENMVLKLNYDNIPNAVNIMDQYKGLYYDPTDEYSVPYNVGTLGLIYNTKEVTTTPTSWDIMWDEQYRDRILMINNPRDGFGIAQLKLGISLNTTDKADWDRALEALKQQKPLVQSYVMDEVFMKMESGEAAIATYYAGDFLTMQENNPDLAMVYPEEGTNIFVDVVCIPTTAQNKTGAEQYIDFLLSPEIALANAEYMCYTTPNKTILENPEYSLKDDPYVNPSAEVIEKAQFYHNLDESTLAYMNSLWDELKIDDGQTEGSSFAPWIIIAAIVLLAAVLIWLRIRKKKKEKMYE